MSAAKPNQTGCATQAFFFGMTPTIDLIGRHGYEAVSHEAEAFTES